MNLTKARHYLQSNTNNERVVDDVENFICLWTFRSEYDLSIISEDLSELTEALQLKFFEKKNDYRVFTSIHCVVYNLLWDNLKPLLRVECAVDDTNVYEKCNALCKNNELPVDINETAYCSVPCTAAIVELSMWDSYNSPLEKLNCLCTTYDIIFAELKAAMVAIISKYSDKELEIPIINNEDVVPIISLVLIKSKLKYACSNLYYIKLFAKKFLEDNNKRYILQIFEQVVLTIRKRDQNDILCGNKEQDRNIDFCEVMQKLTEENLVKNESSDHTRIQEENRKRVLDLIFESTTSNELVSVNLP